MSEPFYLGWSPQLADKARARLGSRRRVLGMTADDRPLPPALSLAQYRKWPLDQSSVGSCFANAPAQLAQIDMVYADPSRAFPVSRALIWYEGRKADGSDGSSSDGGSVTAAVQSLADGATGTGAAQEDAWPYWPPGIEKVSDDRQRNRMFNRWLNRKPPQAVVDAAGKTRFTQFAEVSFGDPWKQQINSGRGIGIGIWWPEGWDGRVDSSGRATGIGPGGYGHALAVIGWIDDWQGHTYWQIENSHGPIYHPLPAEIAARVPGYVPAAPDKTYDFWVRTDWLQQVLNKGNSEAVAIAGPEGFVKREPLSPEAIMPWSTAVYFPEYGAVETIGPADPDDEDAGVPPWEYVLIAAALVAGLVAYVLVFCHAFKVWG